MFTCLIGGISYQLVCFVRFSRCVKSQQANFPVNKFCINFSGPNIIVTSLVLLSPAFHVWHVQLDV